MVDTQVITDLQQYISKKAKLGGTFEIKAAFGIYVGKGKWLKVSEQAISVQVEGKFLGFEFNSTLTLELLGGEKVRLSADSYSSEGTIANDRGELLIEGLNFQGALKPLSAIAIMRWYENETRLSGRYLGVWHRVWAICKK